LRRPARAVLFLPWRSALFTAYDLGVIFADIFACKAQKKQGQCYFDHACVKAPYSVENRGKRTHVNSAARTSSGDVLLNARNLC